MLKESSISHFQLRASELQLLGGTISASLQLEDLTDSLNAVEARHSESFEMPASAASSSIHLICLISS